MKKSILLITGAGGWLGSTLIEMLSKNGISNTYDLIIISSLSSFDYKDIDLGLIKKNFSEKNLILKNIEGDLADNKFYKKLAHLINDNDKLSIVYTSSIIHAKSAKEFRKINFESLKIFVNFIKSFKLDKFIYISSNSPFGFNKGNEKFNESTRYHPIGNYGKTKMLAEQFLLKNISKNYLKILRPPWFHGPNMPERQKLFFKKVSHGSFPIIYPGNNKRSIISTIDLSIAIINFLKKNTQHNIYCLSEPNTISMLEFIKIIQRSAKELNIIKKTKPVFFLPPLTSTFLCMLDIFLQKLGFYSKIIHVVSELGMNIEMDSSRYRKEFPNHKFSTIKETIKNELRETFKEN